MGVKPGVWKIQTKYDSKRGAEKRTGEQESPANWGA